MTFDLRGSADSQVYFSFKKKYRPFGCFPELFQNFSCLNMFFYARIAFWGLSFVIFSLVLKAILEWISSDMFFLVPLMFFVYVEDCLFTVVLVVLALLWLPFLFCDHF